MGRIRQEKQGFIVSDGLAGVQPVPHSATGSVADVNQVIIRTFISTLHSDVAVTKPDIGEFSSGG